MEKEFFVTPIVEGQTRMYCGPTVLALLTGKSREQIHRDINKLRRKHGKKRNKRVYYRDGSYKTTRRVPWPLTAPVKGLSNGYLEALLFKYGMGITCHHNKYPSLRRLVEDMGHFKTPIVINVTNHYVLYFQGKVYDSYRNEGAVVSEHPFGRSRVQRYWIIRKQKIAA